MCDIPLGSLTYPQLLDAAMTLRAELDKAREQLEQAQREITRRKSLDLMHHIKSICDECGHLMGEDGCAWCYRQHELGLEKQLTLALKELAASEENRKELVEALKALLACHHEGALLCSTIENAKKVNEVETMAMKIVATQSTKEAK